MTLWRGTEFFFCEDGWVVIRNGRVTLQAAWPAADGFIARALRRLIGS